MRTYNLQSGTELLVARVYPRGGIIARHSAELVAAQIRARDALVASRFGSASLLRHTPEGSPRIAHHEWTSVSISHCGEIVALAVRKSGLPVGVDVESFSRTEQLARVAPRFLNERQLPLWSASPRLLLSAWVLKEALYKAVGVKGWALRDIPILSPDITLGNRRVSVECFNREYSLSVLELDGFDGLAGVVCGSDPY